MYLFASLFIFGGCILNYSSLLNLEPGWYLLVPQACILGVYGWLQPKNKLWGAIIYLYPRYLLLVSKFSDITQL